MRTKIIVEIPHNDRGSNRVIHRIAMPDYDEPGWYTQTISLSAFHTGRRRGATAEERRTRRDGCCWAPGRLYYCLHNREEDWHREQDRLQARMAEHGISYPDERQCETIEHDSIYAFYEHIGFDRKRRRYKDDNDGKAPTAMA